MGSIKILIHNWEKYNGRKDVTHCSWFRLEHYFMEDPDFYDFSFEEKCVWIYILSQASKFSTPEIGLHPGYAERLCGFKKSAILSAIEKLSHLQIITVSDTEPLRTRNADDTPPIRARSLRDETRRDETNTLVQSVPELDENDFEKIYSKFPRKEGKAKGIGLLRSQKIPKKDLELLLKAVDKYASLQLGKERQYIKQFSSWVECWRDYLAPDVGTVLKKPEKPYAPIVSTPHPGGEKKIKELLGRLSIKSLDEIATRKGVVE